MIYKIKQFSNKYIFTAWVLLAVVVFFVGYSLYNANIVDVPDTEFKNQVQRYHLKDWDWVAIVIAAISLFIALLTFHSQKNTEYNTTKLSEDSQRSLLIDYIRHFYCNHLVLLSLQYRLNGKLDTHYPSEEHLLKLKVDQDAIHLEAFNRDTQRYGQMHKLLLMLRNYNVDVDVAVRHLTDPTLPRVYKERDFNTLLNKTHSLSNLINEKIAAYWPGSPNARDIRRSIVNEAFGRENLGGNANMPYDAKIRLINSATTGMPTLEEVLQRDVRYLQAIEKAFSKKSAVYMQCYLLNITTLIGTTDVPNGEGSPQVAIIPFSK